MVANTPPVLANPDSVIAATGAGPVTVGIGAPVDADNDPLTITLLTLPGYGTLQFFDGTSWVDVMSPGPLTSAQLTSLRYLPPASGEHGGDELVYSVSD